MISLVSTLFCPKSHPSPPTPYLNACTNSSPSTDCPALSTLIMVPFISDGFSKFLQCHHRNHITSSPHFPQSSGFIDYQVRTIKTALSMTQDASKSLKDLLLDMQSTPIGPNMPSSHEILHNRTFQCPSKLSTPVNMEHVWNFLLAKMQSQN